MKATVACVASAQWWCKCHGGTKGACRHVHTPTLKSV